MPIHGIRWRSELLKRRSVTHRDFRCFSPQKSSCSSGRSNVATLKSGHLRKKIAMITWISTESTSHDPDPDPVDTTRHSNGGCQPGRSWLVRVVIVVGGSPHSKTSERMALWDNPGRLFVAKDCFFPLRMILQPPGMVCGVNHMCAFPSHSALQPAYSSILCQIQVSFQQIRL